MKLVLRIILIFFTANLAAQQGIGVTNPHPSSLLEISSTTKGTLIPRMTTAQINAIVSPAKGLMVLDTTVGCLKHYNGTAWKCEGDAGGDHDFYEITLPSTLTTNKPTNISNPVYRRGQTHFISGTNTQNNDAFIYAMPESNRPYGLFVENNITNGALSSGTVQNGIRNQFNLTGSTAFTNTLRPFYNYFNHSGTANTSVVRVAESDADFGGGNHSDVIGTHSTITATAGTINLARGLFGGIYSNGTVGMGEQRGIETIVANQAGTLTLTGSGRGALLQYYNSPGATVSHAGHIMAADATINNDGTLTATASGLHQAGLWVSNNNQATGRKNIANGFNMGIYQSTWNGGIINAASGYGIFNQYNNDSSATYTGEVAGEYTYLTNNTGNSLTSPTIKGGDFKVFNSGTMSGTANYGILGGIGNQISGASINSTSEMTAAHFSINNVAGATITTPTLFGSRAIFTNAGTFNNSAGNATGFNGGIFNTGTWSNSSSIRGGQFTIDNGVGSTMTATTALYGNITLINNRASATLTSPNLYSNIGQINLLGTTNASGETVGNYSNISTFSGSTSNLTNMYGTRTFASNSAGATLTTQTSIGSNAFIQNYSTYNVRDSGGVFGTQNYVYNANTGAINNNQPTNPGLYGAYNYVDNYGSISGTGPMYGSYNFVRNSNTGTSASNTMIGVEGNTQIYQSTFNRPAGQLIGGNFHSDVYNSGTAATSLTIPTKWGLLGYSKREGTNTTETVTDERGIYGYVLHAATGTSNVTNCYGGAFSLEHNGAGTVSNSFGIHVNNIGSGAKTNAYGVYINDVIGTNTYGFYEASPDRNYFAGALGIGTATPGGLLELSLDQGRKPGTNTWTIVSDERLKNIEGNYSKGLAELLKLNPITYHYKNVGERTFSPEVLKTQAVGFSAQEVQKVFPEAVGTDPDGYLNLNTHAIMIAYLNAIKELKAEVDKLKTEVELLKGKK